MELASFFLERFAMNCLNVPTTRHGSRIEPTFGKNASSTSDRGCDNPSLVAKNRKKERKKNTYPQLVALTVNVVLNIGSLVTETFS